MNEIYKWLSYKKNRTKFVRVTCFAIGVGRGNHFEVNEAADRVDSDREESLRILSVFLTSLLSEYCFY